VRIALLLILAATAVAVATPPRLVGERRVVALSRDGGQAVDLSGGKVRLLDARTGATKRTWPAAEMLWAAVDGPSVVAASKGEIFVLTSGDRWPINVTTNNNAPHCPPGDRCVTIGRLRSPPAC